MRRRDKKLLTGLASAGQLRIGGLQAFLAFLVVLSDGARLPAAMAQFSGPALGIVDAGQSTDKNND